MPADDPACGTITCPTDTPCRDWATSITATRCKAIGACKGAADCEYVNAPAKKFCALYQAMPDRAQVCDGNGNCAGPKVTCGADGECPVNSGVCCWTVDSTACLSREQDCIPSVTGLPALCDETADCPGGEVCCLYYGTGGARITCVSDCVTPVPMGVLVQVCNPNTPGECKSGTCLPNAPGGTLPYFTCQ